MIRFTSVAASLLLFAGMSAHGETATSAQMTLSKQAAVQLLPNPLSTLPGVLTLTLFSPLSHRKGREERMSPSYPGRVPTGIPIPSGKRWSLPRARAGFSSGAGSENYPRG